MRKAVLGPGRSASAGIIIGSLVSLVSLLSLMSIVSAVPAVSLVSQEGRQC